MKACPTTIDAGSRIFSTCRGVRIGRRRGRRGHRGGSVRPGLVARARGSGRWRGERDRGGHGRRGRPWIHHLEPAPVVIAGGDRSADRSVPGGAGDRCRRHGTGVRGDPGIAESLGRPEAASRVDLPLLFSELTLRDASVLTIQMLALFLYAPPSFRLFPGATSELTHAHLPKHLNRNVPRLTTTAQQI